MFVTRFFGFGGRGGGFDDFGGDELSASEESNPPIRQQDPFSTMVRSPSVKVVSNTNEFSEDLV